MKIVQSLAVISPGAVGVVCDWCGTVHLRNQRPRQHEVTFRTWLRIGDDGSEIAADICVGCARQQSRGPNTVIGRLVSDASSTVPKDYTVYRYAAFDIASNQIVRVQSLIPFSERTI